LEKTTAGEQFSVIRHITTTQAPNIIIMPAKYIQQICKRCGVLEAVLSVRNEPLCGDCFGRYINTKVVKRMEAFRTRHAAEGEERELLLPLSLGASSVSLLHVLDRHLQGQRDRTGRTGFSLQLLFVGGPDCPVSTQVKRLELVRKRYPQYDFNTLELSDVFRFSTSSIDRTSDQAITQNRLDELLAAIPSATSRADVISILRTRLIVRFAKANNCEGVLWGSSTTKLAEIVLAETAKGRGFSLPWQVTDGLSPFGVPFFFPARDVLKKELIAHAEIDDTGLKDLMEDTAFSLTEAPPSSKNTAIDILMKQYFESVEEHYPSIVSNVVRTSGKLEAPKWDDARRCKLCQYPVDDALLGMKGWGGDQQLHQEIDECEVGLCYGCARSLPKEAVALLP
jgi:cytoplasmic tRNA 2-thiolation protein 2